MTGEFVSREGRLLRIVVATDERNASLHPDGVAQGAEALRALDTDEVGAVLLVGTGPAFCTGGDVASFGAAGADDGAGGDVAAFIRAVADAFHAFLIALVEAPVPVVAAVHGAAAGAGMSIVCAADLAVGGSSTILKPGYPSLGFTPDGGMSWTLPRLVGTGRARSILLRDRMLDAATALDYGLLSEVVPDAEVLATAEKIARRLADGPTRALGGIKQLIADGGHHGLAEHLDAEAASIAASSAHAEGREGVAAFNERRRPSFH
jgi:2-(1,2-epoxy-1,2-dihydrophenyl)acetyl-CoA isomerase